MLFQELLQDEENPNERLFSCFSYPGGGAGFPNHCHLHLEMLYQVAGNGAVVMDGHTHILNAGELVFVPMLKPHAIGCAGDELSQMIVLQISPKYMAFGSDSADFVRRLRCGAAFDGRSYCCLNLEHPARALLEKLGRDCVADWDESSAVLSRKLIDSQGFAAMCRINGTIFSAIAELLKSGVLTVASESNSEIGIHELERLAPVLKRLVSSPEQRFSLEDAAQMVSMSYSAFSRTFSRIIGQSFVDYQNMLRIRVAEDLLRSTNESITLIADRTNFGSLSYFNRVFKQSNGVTPSAYRKGIRAK